MLNQKLNDGLRWPDFANRVDGDATRLIDPAQQRRYIEADAALTKKLSFAMDVEARELARSPRTRLR